MEDIYRMANPQWFCIGDVWRHKKTGVERHILEGDCFPAWIVAARSHPDGFWDRRYMLPSAAANGKWKLISRTTAAALEAASASSGPTGSPTPADGLLQQVSAAICSAADSGDTPQNWAPEARAAILAVAAWLDNHDVGVGRVWARWLREELERD